MMCISGEFVVSELGLQGMGLSFSGGLIGMFQICW